VGQIAGNVRRGAAQQRRPGAALLVIGKRKEERGEREEVRTAKLARPSLSVLVLAFLQACSP
jgi:hypothetical protein